MDMSFYFHFLLIYSLLFNPVSTHLSKRQPARVNQGPQDTKAIFGEDIILFCRAVGNPEPRLSFQWNGLELSSEVSSSSSDERTAQDIIVKPIPPQNSSRTSQDNGWSGGGLSLRVKLQMYNNGDVITCHANNEFGMDSVRATITVYDANEPPPKGIPKIIENPTTTMGQVGDSTHLQCDVEATPPAYVTWIKDTFYPVDITQPRFRMIGTGSLVIESLVEEDSGVYECVARNIIGTAISNAGYLTVRRIEFPPVIQKMAEQVFVSPGRSTNLTCRANGFPLPAVWWATVGTPVVSLGQREVVGSPIYSERALMEPQTQQATLRLTDVTDQLTYICIAKNSLGIVRRNISVIVMPLPDPPIWIDVRPVEGTFAVLRWKSSKASQIESYTLTVESKDNQLGSLGRRQVANIQSRDFHISMETDQQLVTYNLTDLSPYMPYVARVQAVNKRVGLGQPSLPIEFQTAELAPGQPPQDIRLRVTGPTVLEVTWGPPLQPNGKIMGYKVYYTTRKSDQIGARRVKRTPNQKIRLVDLAPNATYIVCVSPYNSAGDGPVSDEVSVLILPGVPSQPQNFRGFAVEADTIQMMWSTPDIPQGQRLIDYRLWYGATSNFPKTDLPETTMAMVMANNDGLVEESKDIKAEATQFTLKDLRPGTMYYFRLAGRTSNGFGAAASTHVRTQEYLPEIPQGKEIIFIDPRSFKVSWLGPEERLTEVRHYKLSWNPVGIMHSLIASQSGSQHILVNPSDPQQLYSTIINDLLPNTAYRVSIAAANVRGLGKEYIFPIISTWTEAQSLEGQKAAISSSPSRGGFIVPDWQKYWQLPSQVIAPLRPLKLRQTRLLKQTRRVPLPSDDPRSVEPLPYIALELAWDRPVEYSQDDQLVYQVSATPIVLPLLPTESRKSFTSPSNLRPQSGGVWIEGTRILANVTKESFVSTESDDLGFGITYLFQVAVINSSVVGTSARINVTTPESSPSSFPLKLKVRGISSTAVEVIWEPPALQYRNGRLTSYQVRFFEVGAEIETQKVVDVLVPEQLSYTAKDLKTQTYYSFLVRAFTNVGPGPWTRANNVRTTIELPPPPVDVQATRINQHQIKVTWKMPEVDSAPSSMLGGPARRHVAVQGFRLLYAPNDNAYDSGQQWTTFDVGPVVMTIISGLVSRNPYIIRIRSRGPDGQFGEWSEVVEARPVPSMWETEFSVQSLLCSPSAKSAKITWQRPKTTKGLIGFNLRISGSKRFADESGANREHAFEPKSGRVAFFDAHEGYSYVMEELEPNTIYDVQINAYYEKVMNLEGNWGTTSCHTIMQKPTRVPAPLPISATEDMLQVNLKVFRVSERLGKIRQYYLVISPHHLLNQHLDEVTVDDIITSSRGLPSSKTRYIAAQFTQDYFEPAGTSSRDFILGGEGGGGEFIPPSPTQTQRSRRSPLLPRQLLQRTTNWLMDGGTSKIDDYSMAIPLADSAVVLDNKALETGQVYSALVLACVFQEDLSTLDSFSTCTPSPWSSYFATNPELPALLALRSSLHAPGSSIAEGSIGESYTSSSDSSSSTFSASSSTDLYTVSILAVILGVAVVTTICTVLVCVFRRRRQPKLLTRPVRLDQGLKQPLMNVADGTSASHNSGGIGQTFFPNANMSTVCANNGALSMSPPGYTQLVAMASATSDTFPRGYHDGTHVNTLPRDYQYRSDSSGLSGTTPMPAIYPNSERNPLGESTYPSSPRWRQSGGRIGFMMNGANGPQSHVMNGYNTCGSNGNRFVNASVVENGRVLFNEAGDDDNSMELQHLFCGNNAIVRRPIPAAYLTEHIMKLGADDNRLFSQEYESIDPGHQFSWENSNMEVNKAKNRYANVIAYDHSRVILRALDGVPGSDYINANYIDGYKKPNCYIATQGPLPETYSDFWRMIWEQRVSIIVMMTRLEERARIKCDQYWPSRGQESYVGGLITVTPKESVELAYFTIRKFSIHGATEEEIREVVHLQFTHWPDHGVPDSPIPLLLFMRKIRAITSSSSSSVLVGGKTRVSSVPGSLLGSGITTSTSHESDLHSGPITVHCSAGVGRTGSLIALDIMHDQMKYENAVDVLSCVTALRAQRNFMVQTEEQYIFVYSALLEMAEGGYTEVPVRGLFAQFNSLLQPDEMGFCGFDIEFNKFKTFFLPKALFTSALLPPNKCKNRFFEVLPYELTRVALTPIRGIDGSDYINASFVDSYRSRQAYIATQGPLAETLEDFWRMIWEHNSAIIVMLSQPTEQGNEHSYPYWPSKRSARYQYYVIDPMVEYNMPTYTLREFKVTDTRDGVSRTIRQFQFTEWPEVGIPANCEAFTNFITQIHKTKEQFGQDGPITVHCSCGSGRTGVFLLLSIVLERLRSEGVVDILQTIRLLRTQRTHMIQSPEQLKFCYKAILEYISSALNSCAR